MPPQSALFLTSSVPQDSESIAQSSLSLLANFAQNLMFILRYEFQLLFIRRETQTQFFMPQF
jgi:hypothetical protein